MLNELQMAARADVERRIASGEYAFEPVSCPVCDEWAFEPLAEKDRYGLYMPVVICTVCGLVQTNPRMTTQSYEAFYRREYRRLYDGTESATEDFFRNQYRKGARIHDRLVSSGLLRLLRGRYVLEVGCGAGGILQYFKEPGWRVRGIDPGADYVRFGRERGLDLSAGTLASIAFDEKPDLVIYADVFEHLTDPNAELRRLHTLLPDDAAVYVEVPGIGDIGRRYDGDILLYLQNAHVYHFTLSSLTNLVVRNGFTVLGGTHEVACIFRKANPGAPAGMIRNDFQETHTLLRTLERDKISSFLAQYAGRRNDSAE